MDNTNENQEVQKVKQRKTRKDVEKLKENLSVARNKRKDVFQEQNESKRILDKIKEKHNVEKLLSETPQEQIEEPPSLNESSSEEEVIVVKKKRQKKKRIDRRYTMTLDCSDRKNYIKKTERKKKRLHIENYHTSNNSWPIS